MKTYSSFFLLFIFAFSICFGQHKHSGLFEDGYDDRYVHGYAAKQKLIAEFKKALKNDSTDYKYLSAIAVGYYGLKKQDSAKFYAQQSLSLKKDYAPNYWLIATIFQSNGHYDSGAVCYDLAVKYETNLAQKKMYKQVVLNNAIKNDNFVEAYRHSKEMLAIDTTDFKANYYHARIANRLGYYQEAKNSILANLQHSDFENKDKEVKAKHLLELLSALFELNDRKNFDLYWEQVQDLINEKDGKQKTIFLRYTYLAGYENKLPEKLKLNTETDKTKMMTYLKDFISKQDCEKVRFYCKRLNDENLKKELLARCK